MAISEKALAKYGWMMLNAMERKQNYKIVTTEDGEKGIVVMMRMLELFALTQMNQVSILKCNHLQLLSN